MKLRFGPKRVASAFGNDSGEKARYGDLARSARYGEQLVTEDARLLEEVGLVGKPEHLIQGDLQGLRRAKS
jgi:hypothetical protein